MRVLVTGATGFIGRTVVQALRARGDDVVALARPTSKAWKIEALHGMGAEVALGDVTDVESLITPMRDVDAVIHAAATVRFGKVDADAMTATNVTGTENVLQVARDLSVPKVVHVSSIAALGIHGDGTVDETAQHPGDAATPYERTKHMASLVADDHARRGLHVVSALPAVVFGSRDPNFGAFLKGFVRRRFPVLPAPETVVSLVHVEDLARGILLALDRGRRGEKFVFTQANVTLRELFGRLEDATGIRGPRIVVPSKIARGAMKTAATLAMVSPWRGHLNHRSGDMLGKKRYFLNRSAVERLGWDPGPFEARMASTARWYAHHYCRGRDGPGPLAADGTDPTVDPSDLSVPPPRRALADAWRDDPVRVWLHERGSADAVVPATPHVETATA